MKNQERIFGLLWVRYVRVGLVLEGLVFSLVIESKSLNIWGSTNWDFIPVHDYFRTQCAYYCWSVYYCGFNKDMYYDIVYVKCPCIW